MIQRHTDADEINAIANSTDVRKLMFLGAAYPPQHLDFSAWVDDPRNHALTCDGFAAIFVFRGPGIYECHIMARQSSRGKEAIRIGRDMLAYMKEQGAEMVWGQPSIYNKAAIWYIRAMGLVAKGAGTDTVAGEVQYFVTEGL